MWTWPPWPHPEVASGNVAAMAAYLRAGFTVTDRAPFAAGGTVLEQPVK